MVISSRYHTRAHWGNRKHSAASLASVVEIHVSYNNSVRDISALALGHSADYTFKVAEGHGMEWNFLFVCLLIFLIFCWFLRNHTCWFLNMKKYMLVSHVFQVTMDSLGSQGKT